MSATVSAPMISEIIEIQDGYTEYVDLGLELFDDNRNGTRMKRYRPIASHRQAFQRMARSLNVKDKRCYLLTGSYGTGKSHLCLMFANYLQTPAGEPPMPEFFANYSDVDAVAAEDLKTRRSKGRYLVALCNWGGRGDFEDVVLRAVDVALRREDVGAELETPYLAALRKLDEWKTLADEGDGRGRFYTEAETELAQQNSGLTLAALRKGLAEFDPDLLAEFKRIHQALTTAPFTLDKEDLLPILTSILQSSAFKDRYLGLLVLFDEFGDTMERGKMSPKAFTQFAQICAETPADAARLVFVGTAHRDLTWYAKAYNANDFRTASDRIEPVPLATDGVEDIIAAIVVPQKQHALWQSEVASRSTVLDALLTGCTRLKLFNWLKGPKVRQAIIEDIYPMHPMATYALLQLARDVASNNRSVFTFFTGGVSPEPDPASYRDYITGTPIVSDGKLNLYTADLLCDYFAPALRSDNRELRETIREQIKDYENSLRELNRAAAQDATVQMQFQGDNLVGRLLRLMLVYAIIQVPITPDNLQFGLNCVTQTERAELANRLRDLWQRGVIYFVKETSCYEFKKSTGVDLDRLIDAYKQDPKNMPGNLAAELNVLAPLNKADLYLEAKDYNMPYGEDKRLERRLVRAVDLGVEEALPGGKRSYFATLEAEIDQEVARRGEFEGIALHVICETGEEIQRARDFCARNESNRIAVAIPKQPIPLFDPVLELRALMSIEKSEGAKNYTMQDRAALNARLHGEGTKKGAYDALRTLRDKLFNPKEITWYGRYAQPLPTQDNKAHDAANSVMELLYADERNKFVHDDFNKLRVKVERSKSVALKEAVEKLLNYTEPLSVDTSFAQQRGDIRYLQKCLLNNGVLVQSKTSGVKLQCEVVLEPQKYASKLPALASMVEEIRRLGPSERLKIGQWVAKHRRPPYGQGSIALCLALACLRRMFGDSIRFKQDENSVGDLPVNSFDTVVSLIEGQYPNAFLSYRPLRPEEKALVKLVFDLFGQQTSAAARDYTVVEAHAALQTWWDTLPPLARVPALYPTAQFGATGEFLAAMQKIAARDAQAFLFDELPSAFGGEAGTMITQPLVDFLAEQLPVQKQILDGAFGMVEQQIMEAVRELFQVEQSTYTDIQDAIRAWYNGLDSSQRDTFARWHDNDSKPLAVNLKSVESLQDTFLVKIPQAYNLKPVRDWVTNRVKEYTDRLRSGKERIEANKLKVDPPEPEFEGEYTRDGESSIRFKDCIKVRFEHKDSAARIYVAEGSADPTDANAPRAQLNGAGPLVIEDNKTIRYAAQDVEGNWSSPAALQFTNQNREFEIRLPQQLTMGRQPITFNCPVDEESFGVAARSLFRLGLDRQIITRVQLLARLQAMIDELQRGE